MRPIVDVAEWLSSGAARVVAASKAAADRQYTRSIHLVIKNSTSSHRFALFGGYRLRHHLSRVYFGEGHQHRLRLGWHRGDFEGASARVVRQYGLAVFTGDAIPTALAPHALRVPLMIEFEKPMRDVLEGSGAEWTRSAKADIARVKRAGFRCTVDRGTDWIPTFRREFSVPSMTHRHGVEAIMATARDLRQTAEAEGTEFLRIWLNEAWVGGILNSQSPEGYRLRYLGWRHGDARLLQQGVVAALYWFSLLRASELGHTRCLLGGAWPYLEDGLVFYKGKWGARLDASSTRFPDIHVLLDPAHEACRTFLNRQSLVTRGAGGDFVVFSARTPVEMRMPPSILASVSRWYRWRRPEEPPRPVEHPDVPAHLRSWLISERVSSTDGSS